MPAGRPSTFDPDRVSAICADIEDGHSERTSAEANDVPWSTWSAWKNAHPEILDQLNRARALGNRRLGCELLAEIDPVRAKVRLHLLACRDPEWREEKRVEHRGQIGILEALATPELTADAGGD